MFKLVMFLITLRIKDIESSAVGVLQNPVFGPFFFVVVINNLLIIIGGSVLPVMLPAWKNFIFIAALLCVLRLVLIVSHAKNRIDCTTHFRNGAAKRLL